MPTAGKSTVIPGLRYRDAPAAIDWLCRVLGFSANLVVPGNGGAILHAQLTLGSGMVMLGSERDDAHGELMSVPGPGGANTQSAYVVVDDPEAAHERAVAAGAEIVSPLDNPEYGGTFFACRDPEGHVRNVGSCDPWAHPHEQLSRRPVARSDERSGSRAPGRLTPSDDCVGAAGPPRPASEACDGERFAESHRAAGHGATRATGRAAAVPASEVRRARGPGRGRR